MSTWVMQAHFKYLRSKSFLMISFQSNEFWPLHLPFKDSGVHWDFNSQSGSSFGSVRVHSLTLSCTLRSMKYDSRVHSWPAPSQALALVVSPRLGSQHLYHIVQSDWWWCENMIALTPHQINKPPTSYERSNLFLLFF